MIHTLLSSIIDWMARLFPRAQNQHRVGKGQMKMDKMSTSMSGDNTHLQNKNPAQPCRKEQKTRKLNHSGRETEDTKRYCPKISSSLGKNMKVKLP